ncbi:MAG: LacI family DNA-binding transcriptional regulator [Lachnospiraceae bacterium]|nr:LacI family DNA-binding transcriptional regulator [Lachnospiraceae bacterium]
MTINEIAAMAGVSRATVSRYLNDGYVSEEKREKIRRVIEETGYEPSVQAQQLRLKRTNIIGVIIPKINSESVSRMVAGISVVLAKEGYQMLLANTDNDEKEELKYLNLFKYNQVDGVILIGTILTKAHKERLREMQVPVVLLGQTLTGYSCVYHDDYHAAKEMTERMAKHAGMLGYIGVTQRDVAAGKERRRGFVDGAGSQVKTCFTEGAFSMDAGYEGCKRLLDQEPGLDGIFCATDSIAVGAMMCLEDAGKRIPEDVALAGVGDSMMAKVTKPSIATVHFYYKTSGMEAARLLFNRIQNPEAAVREVKMGYEIVEGGSLR